MNNNITMVMRSHGRGNGFRGGTPLKKREYLTGDFARDMKSLRIKGSIRNPQTRKETYVDETPQFITYLTLALQNISDIVGEDLSKIGPQAGAPAVEKAIMKSGKLWEVASFLWIHREDQPKRDFDKKSDEAMREQYAEEIRLLRKGISLRNISKITGTSVNTIRKCQSLI